MLHPPVGGPGSWQSPLVPEAHGILQQLLGGGTAAGVASCSGQSRSAGEASTADTAKWKAHTPKGIEIEKHPAERSLWKSLLTDDCCDTLF